MVPGLSRSPAREGCKLMQSSIGVTWKQSKLIV
jgi:hypothetical protein